MSEILTIIGLLGAVASIIGYILPSPTRGQRFTHALYGFIIVILSSTSVHYKLENQRLNKAESEAKILLKQKEMKFTDSGFIGASLTYFEKYKDLFPDTYHRAQQLCEQNQCLKSGYSSDMDSLTHGRSQIHVSYTFSGMLRGISILSSE